CCVIYFSWCCFFFFQAEDGIRDFHVTGVQTCALPISNCTAASASPTCWACRSGSRASPSTVRCWVDPSTAAKRRRACRGGRDERSEERRVGKEGRCRW